AVLPKAGTGLEIVDHISVAHDVAVAVEPEDRAVDVGEDVGEVVPAGADDSRATAIGPVENAGLPALVAPPLERAVGPDHVQLSPATTGDAEQPLLRIDGLRG